MHRACQKVHEHKGSMLLLKELHGAFVTFGGRPAAESAEVLAPTGAAISLARIQPILTRFEFADHRGGSFYLMSWPSAVARSI